MFWFDLILLLVILASMLVGFHHGVVRQGMNLFALLFALLVAATYQGRASRAISGLLGASSDPVRQTFVFVIIVLAVWGLATLAMNFAFRQTRFQTGQTVDRLLGICLGVINGVVWALFLVMVIGFMTSVPWADYEGMRRALERGLEASLLRPTVLQVLPLVGNAMKPLLPTGLPPIFYQTF